MLLLLQLLGETPVHARVKPGSLKVIVSLPPVVATTESEAPEGQAAELAKGQASAEGANDEGNGSASLPDGSQGASALVEASAQVEDKPVVAHTTEKA